MMSLPLSSVFNGLFRPTLLCQRLNIGGIQPAVAFCRAQGIYSTDRLVKPHISTMQQMVIDHPRIPATSCEAEWTFNGCKYTISDHQSRLGEDILEALEYDGA